MRILNALNNGLYSGVNIILITIFNIVYRTVFIQTLGIEVLGINTALTNIITVLSLAELGFSQAISYLLYKPLSQNNREKINAFINYIKRVYIIIGIIIIFSGLSVIPFLKLIIPTDMELSYLTLIYILFISNTVITYFCSYKRTLIIADQKNYKIIPTISKFQLLDLVGKSIILFITKSFVTILIFQIIIKVLENIYVNKIIDNNYTSILGIEEKKLTFKDKKLVKEKTIAVFFHKIGDVFVNSTGNLVISAFIGVSVLGIYSNYVLVIGILVSFISIIYNSLTSSFGNLIIENKNNCESNFYIIQLISFYIFGITSIIFYFYINKIIYQWIGVDYILPNSTIALITLNYLLLGIRLPLNVIKIAGGIFDKDKYAPLIQGLINLVACLLLVNLYGINGVLIASLMSTLIVPIWVQPYIVYKHIFHKKLTTYIKNTTKNLFYIIISLFFIIAINNYFLSDNLDTNLLVTFGEIFGIVILYTVIFIVLSYKSQALKELVSKLNQVINKKCQS